MQPSIASSVEPLTALPTLVRPLTGVRPPMSNPTFVVLVSTLTVLTLEWPLRGVHSLVLQHVASLGKSLLTVRTLVSAFHLWFLLVAILAFLLLALLIYHLPMST